MRTHHTWAAHETPKSKTETIDGNEGLLREAVAVTRSTTAVAKATRFCTKAEHKVAMSTITTLHMPCLCAERAYHGEGGVTSNFTPFTSAFSRSRKGRDFVT